MLTLDGVPTPATKFPDGTSQVWKLDLLDLVRRQQGGGPPAVVEWTWTGDESEFMHLAQLKELLDAYGLRAELSVPYLPYARQDKPVGNQETFALRTFARLLGSLGFERVVARDPHSDVAAEFVPGWAPETAAAGIARSVALLRPDCLCFPDEGATRRYQPLAGKTPFFAARKLRNSATGEVLGVTLKPASGPGPSPRLDPAGDGRVLVVDDLCDGGATFVAIAAVLREAGAKELGLYVSHGLFSKGFDALRQAGYSRFFTLRGEIPAGVVAGLDPKEFVL